MKEVTREEYYASFTNKDAIHTVDNSNGFPYTDLWTLRGNPHKIIAKAIPQDSRGNEYKYYII